MMARSEARSSGETCKSMAPFGAKILGDERAAISLRRACHPDGLNVNYSRAFFPKKKSADRRNTAGAV
jgi:hypothetical protein